MTKHLNVGDVVVLKCPCMGNRTGDRGVVYECYDLGAGPAVSVIFKNGNYDGFSPEEQDAFLEGTDHVSALAMYQFDNVMRLTQDFERGMFDAAFSPETSIEQSRRQI